MTIHNISDTINYQLTYKKVGVGKKCILAFHGFGLDKDCFDIFFNEDFLNDYTVYSFDLFFHGDSIVYSDYTIG